MGAAHAKGLVHRDLKLANVIVADGRLAKVLDFGRANLGGESKSATRTGTRMGTLLYMSPEQVRGAKSVDARSDIWSLGVMLYELLTGQVPFDGEDDLDTMNAIVAGRYPPAAQLNPRVPGHLDAAIAKALTVAPAGRHPSTGAFAQALAVDAAPQSPIPPAPSPVVVAVPSPRPARNRYVAVAVAAVALLGVVGFVMSNSGSRPPAPVASGSCPKGMAFIPGGSFDMGSNDGDSDEKPVHRVTVSGFCMDVTEYAEGDGMPKINVSWDEAKALCESQGKRLPTEAEWEFAARGPAGRKYPWGNGEPTCDRANYAECRYRVKRVGSLPAGATPEGLQDMAGNVREWVADCYEGYSSSPQNNPSKEQCSGLRVFRGGGWSLNAARLRASVRYGYGAGSRSSFLGFRCARGVGR